MATQPQMNAQTVLVSLPDEEFATLAQLAEAEHTSIAELVRAEVIQFAQAKTRASHSPEEILEIIGAAQAELRAANPGNRDLVAELLEERRCEAARE